MRVTDGMIWGNMQRNVAARQTDFANAQERAVTGRRVNAPSDDPAAFSQARTETGNLARAQGYERSVNVAKPVLETTDSALTTVESIVQRIRDIAVEGANDTLNGNDRNTLNQELSQLKDQLIGLGNTTSGDRFIFAGYKENVPPFDAAGVYSGDTQVQQVEVSRGINLPLGVTGDSVFGTAGADVFTTITNLQTELSAGNSAGVSALITEVDTRFEQVRKVHTQVGIHLNAADIAEAVATRAQDTATTNRSQLVEIDAAKAYTDLAKAQTALSAAIQIAGQLPPPGLVNRSR